MKKVHMVAITAQFRQVFAWLAHEIECACMIIIGRCSTLDGHILPRRRHAQLSWHARGCNSIGASSCLSHHRDPARTQGVECSSHRVVVSTTIRSEESQPPHTTEQGGKAFGYDSFTLIRLVLSAFSKGAPLRRTWSITSLRTAATMRCSGIKRAGKRCARPAARIGINGLSVARGRGVQIAIG